MKYQVILSTVVVTILLASDIHALLAQPFAPLDPAVNGAPELAQPANNSQNFDRPGLRPRFVPASGAPRVATLPNNSTAVTGQATSSNDTIDDVYEPTTVLATVGPEYILAGDLIPQVEIVMWLMFKDSPPEELAKHKKQIDAQKEMLLKNLLSQAIDSKLLYLAFKRSMKPEELEQFEERATEVVEDAFLTSIDETLLLVKSADKQEMKRLRAKDIQIAQLCTLMVEHDVESLRELDAILRKFGSSLEQAKNTFAETNFGRQAISLDVKLQYEITHQDMLDYYLENSEDYQINEAVSFQQLAVHFKNHETKQQAYQKICALGNSVLQGAPFEKVAISHSEGPKAKLGGRYENIEKGDLVSEKVETVAFDIPVNRMSPIIEDDKGFYIIRIYNYRQAGKEKFTEVQGNIEQMITNQRRNDAIQKYIKQVGNHVPVWNRLEEKKP
ncbi:MAG: peptidylprolyl isomerase [Planctomycetota bacterium]|nr:peptidylprolyl isomerase [Planctomycetota bacterium]